MTSKQINQQLINDFAATRQGKGLEDYLKNKAWKADLEGETKVYLVKDREGSIALFKLKSYKNCINYIYISHNNPANSLVKSIVSISFFF